jgi:hypothetical protein
MAVAQDLHFDMTGALYQFFQIDFAIAKSGFRLSPSGINLFTSGGGPTKIRPFAAQASAKSGFSDINP